MAYSKVIIAEKPSLGKAIAEGFSGESSGSRTHIIVGNVAITWVFGHVYGLQEADDYDQSLKFWSMAKLPIFPNPFKLKPSKTALEQIAKIKELISETNLVIHAGDPDREGQMIVDEVLSELEFKGQVKRLMLNSADPTAVKKALASLQDNAIYKPLYEAAKCRAQADWLVGINITRAVTLGLTSDGKSLVTIGRVQTPTLAMLVNRDNLIDKFVPKTFYKLEATVKTESGKTVTLSCDPTDELRLWKKEDAEALAAKLKGNKVKLSVEQVNASKGPEKLFNVLGFSKAMYALTGISPKKSAELLQALYEAKLTTYPRTEHVVLPIELKPEALTVSAHLMANSHLNEFKKLSSLMSPKDSNYNLPKSAEHHAIVPTTKPADGVFPAGCEQAYFVIARRFLLSLLPDYKYKSTTISFIDAPYAFRKKGEVALNLEKSWKAFETKKDDEVLPNIVDGEAAQIISVEVTDGQTTPPKRYNSVSLMDDMGAVAKYVDDPKLKSILKENAGIGTAATQPAIIDNLIQKGFAITDAKGNLISTDFGKEVIEKIPAQLKNPGVTALWEDALSMIAGETYEPAVFMQKIEAYTVKLIDEIKASVNKISQKPQAVSAPPRSESSTASSSHKKRTSKASSSKKSSSTLAR